MHCFRIGNYSITIHFTAGSGKSKNCIYRQGITDFFLSRKGIPDILQKNTGRYCFCSINYTSTSNTKNCFHFFPFGKLTKFNHLFQSRIWLNTPTLYKMDFCFFQGLTNLFINTIFLYGTTSGNH